MTRHRGILSSAVPALFTLLLASSGGTPADPTSSPSTDPANERGVPALFSWGDMDGDGRLDLAAVTSEGTLQLLANAGEGRFEDVTARVGLSEVGNAALALWADYDGDGRLDLFVGAQEGASRLFRNQGGSFIDMSVGSGLVSEGAVQSAQWFDHDGDGRLDLFVLTAEKNALFRGLEGGFFERAELPLAGKGSASVLGGFMDGNLLGAPSVSGSSSEDGHMRASGSNGRSRTVDGVNASGSPIALGLPPTVTEVTPISFFPTGCASSIKDQANPGTCLNASTIPTLGRLYPITANLFVAVGGNVGINNTSPSARLDVAGTARITDTLTLNPSGDQALDVSTGSIYKGGTLFIHTKGSGQNTALGENALEDVTTGDRNTATGFTALANNTTGLLNSATGSRALHNNTTGSFNTAMGASALFLNTTGGGNTASGHRALFNNTTGSNNTATGVFALDSNVTGVSNTATGLGALQSNTTGNNNTAIGYQALVFNSTGNGNTANGMQALRSNSTGSNNTANGTQSLYSNTTGIGNTATGFDALRSNTTGGTNTANGNYALFSNTTGNRNTASGFDALKSNTTGSDNTASGRRALFSNTTGFRNTAHGAGALFSNTTGRYNTASGYRALYSSTTSIVNTAIGDNALFSNTTGGANTGSGYRVLYSNTTGNDNTASGVGALVANTTGNRNTAIGRTALYLNSSGSRNIALGYRSGRYLTTGNDNIAIGNYGVAGEGGTIRIGISGTQTRTFIAGIRGVTTGIADAIPVVVDSAGQLGTVSSSRRFKKDIADMGEATERLLELRPVVFHYKREQALPGGGEVPLEYGLIAEEVAEVFPDLVVYDEEGEPFTVKYHILSSMLLNELKELDERFEAQSETHARELEELQSRLAVIEARTAPATLPGSR